MFWLGKVVAYDSTNLRRLFQVLSILGVLLALHTIIETTTGVFLFASARDQAYVASLSNYQLGVNLAVTRSESFFIDPNWNGTFLAIALFIPLGLFVESPSYFGKVVYFAEILIMAPALLFTYSASAWIAVFGGMLAFIVLIGKSRYRFQISFFLGAAALILFVGFPEQINFLQQHATNPSELELRNAVWQTALKVIEAHPLTGVGLGHQAYLTAAEPLRVPAQTVPLDHPHNSYLEWGAMAGIPVLLVFLALLASAWGEGLRHWKRVDDRTRTLLGAGIAATIALSICSWSNQGWTLPPLAGVGWLILGAISPPLLAESQEGQSPRDPGKQVKEGS